MPLGPSLLSRTLTVLVSSLFYTAILSKPAVPGLAGKSSNPLNIDWGPAPDPENGPPFSAGALRNSAYLAAEIGGVIAAYGVSLVLVAITLLSLARKRREHLRAGHQGFVVAESTDLYSPVQPPVSFSSFPDAPHSAAVPNFSYPSPIRSEFNAAGPCTQPSPTSTINAPGVHPAVDQRVVQADRKMAQQRLGDMYKHVIEHDDAKQKGVMLQTPIITGPSQHRSSGSILSSKEKAKPASLILGGSRQEKTQSIKSSLFSALRSPKKKSMKGVTISSPIITPQSSTFPRNDMQEMDAMVPRLYARLTPPPAPPMSVDALSSGSSRVSRGGVSVTADMSPQSVQSIDERISTKLGPLGSDRSSQSRTEVDPYPAMSEHSRIPLVGLPSSPKPGAKSPPLPLSPKPGAGFQRPNAPSAVRAGGNLPLRAYETAMDSPSAISHTTKQTVFERKGPISPTTGRAPQTAGAVPYSPYQPYTPCIPMTPSLVTKEDRKRMKKIVPKTPTLEMVKSSEELW